MQGLKNGQQILAIVLSETPTEAKEAEDRILEVEAIKADTKLLASDDDRYLQVGCTLFI